ncbi:MAG: hypothetical protein ABL891_21455 [Burkholderiales bacterium]
MAGFSLGEDRAYWISWFNLPEESRYDFSTWAYESYVPAVLAREGILWGALYASEAAGSFTPLGGGGRISPKKNPKGVPVGDRYIMMFGASDAYDMANPAPDEFHATLSADDKKMLALRTDERRNIMLEEARIEGPGIAENNPVMAPAPAIQLGSFNAGAWSDEEALAAWYARWRLPSLMDLPGCVRVRKLVSVAGWAKHACFYEFNSLQAREEHFVHYEKSNPEMVKWSTDVVRDTVHAPGSANVASRIFYILKTNT